MVSIRTRFDLIGLSVMYMFIDLASAQGLYYLMVVVLDHEEMSAIEIHHIPTTTAESNRYYRYKRQ